MLSRCPRKSSGRVATPRLRCRRRPHRRQACRGRSRERRRKTDAQGDCAGDGSGEVRGRACLAARRRDVRFLGLTAQFTRLPQVSLGQQPSTLCFPPPTAMVSRWAWLPFFSFLLAASSVVAYEVPIAHTDYDRQICSGMWAGKNTYINGASQAPLYTLSPLSCSLSYVRREVRGTARLRHI